MEINEVRDDQTVRCPAIESEAFNPVAAKILTRVAGPRGLSDVSVGIFW